MSDFIEYGNGTISNDGKSAEALIKNIESSYNLLFNKLATVNNIADSQMNNESKNCVTKIIESLEMANSWFDETKLFVDDDFDNREDQAFQILEEELNRKSNLINELELRISEYKDKVNELQTSLN